MAAGATKSQRYNRQRWFYGKVMRAARKTAGLKVEKARGQGPKVTTATGWVFRFGMGFSSMSNGETVSSAWVDVSPPNLEKAGDFYTFNSWSWTGSRGNKSLTNFWNRLYDRHDNALLLGDLIDAYEMDRVGA